MDVSATVAEIIAKVRAEGDAALRYYSEKFDKANLTSLRVSEEEMEEAVASVEPEFIRILETAAENIRSFHALQKREGFELRRDGGVIITKPLSPAEMHRIAARATEIDPLLFVAGLEDNVE